MTAQAEKIRTLTARADEAARDLQECARHYAATPSAANALHLEDAAEAFAAAARRLRAARA